MTIARMSGEHVRRETARWILRIYAGMTILGIILHVVRNVTRQYSLNWLYIIPMAIIAVVAVTSLWRLKQSLAQAMFLFAGVVFVCLSILLIHEIAHKQDYRTFMLLFHAGVLTLGLVLGFKAALYYATASAIVFSIVGFRYLGFFNMILPIVLAYAVAIPARIVELMIEQSTQELTQINQNLEELVAARTAELAESNRQLQAKILERAQAEEALRRRTQELESRNEELNAYAHTVAHDIKAPLATIIGFSELLEKHHKQYPEDKLSYYLGVLARNGRKITNIVDELLLLASVREVDTLEVESLDMAVVVDEALQRLSDLIANAQPEIVIPDAWPAAIGYGPWIEEVWTNYISNAIKYGGASPRVELGATSIGNSHIQFWVRDNGKGLTPEEQARLFTPFTRLNQISARGHGLGLSIVRRIVEKLDGQVGVESEVGQGSTFFFTLPSAQTEDAPYNLTTSSAD
ncbi:MAG TPA: HAMP domain-containing sensor histidine kinase [Anaerolineae bacterium]|nr:HAMP domain-containing sensor histidine kinase [Anaerolineae bacterium]HQI85263.1 HAMP domain-containing sensor histidine kinase [Anaerolineae bacterium]